MSFSSINPEEIVISSDSIISTLWSNSKTVINTIYKQPEINTKPFLDVYSNNPSLLPDSSIQFSLIYGNKEGSGSALINPIIPHLSPTRITYGQIRTLINGDENTSINFGEGNTSSPDFYLININRSRYKEKLFLSTFNLSLGGLSGSIYLTNNSNDSTVVNYCDAGRVFDIVSGSNGNSITGGGKTVSGSYGKFLPDVGLILLNPQALSLPYISGGIDMSIDLAPNNEANINNNNTLFNAINIGGYFSLNSEETITSDYVFVRIKNSEFNYTTNPSVINNNGEFYYNSLINNPQTFITTVGLYNDANELLAVAKLSKPLRKDFTKECLLRIKIDF
jgi:hypothetical protein